MNKHWSSPWLQRREEVNGGTRSENEVLLRATSWAYNKNRRSSGPYLSHRLLAPGLSIPSGPASGSRSARCSFALSRAGREHALTPKASAGRPSKLRPAPGGPRRARTAPREPPLRGPEMGAQKEDLGPPLPPCRRGSSSRPIPAYRATGGTSTSRWKLRRREQACPSNAFQSLQIVTRSRPRFAARREQRFFPSMSWVAARRTPLCACAVLPLWRARCFLGSVVFALYLPDSSVEPYFNRPRHLCVSVFSPIPQSLCKIIVFFLKGCLLVEGGSGHKRTPLSASILLWT